MNSRIPHFLEEILSFFPVISPPVTLSEDVALKFSSHNKPLPLPVLNETFTRWDTFDEFTELVPCFQMPADGQYFTLVWWKGSLLSYEYILATISQEGIIISKKVIAGTLSDGNKVVRSVATIDEDFCVYTVAGESDSSKNNYKPTNTTAYRFEILPDGKIYSTEEDINPWEERQKENQT